MTLDEIWKEHQKPVKVKRGWWSPGQWFFIQAKCPVGVFIGWLSNGSAEICSNIFDDWSVYTEPKPKKILYQAVYREDAHCVLSHYLYESETHAKKHYSDELFVRLLTDRPIEVSE